MLHWTLLPEEIVFQDLTNAVPPIHETIVDGVRLLVQQDGDAMRVVRLLSPDPAHFLDPRFQPGNVIFHSS
ncbi:YlzJ-like family protein [Shimazuella sp. AN120528]|uniref:YlzJ-like family protein n=1 Tax=Shimazuella soli TaxID=1892854 RepID=UPI001F0CF57F|nr:YlzJ-like family protein [Shimazuella soli]MCH5586440.1 YlzJ-like family protein [Shimazuella soli]